MAPFHKQVAVAGNRNCVGKPRLMTTPPRRGPRSPGWAAWCASSKSITQSKQSSSSTTASTVWSDSSRRSNTVANESPRVYDVESPFAFNPGRPKNRIAKRDLIRMALS